MHSAKEGEPRVLLDFSMGAIRYIYSSSQEISRELKIAGTASSQDVYMHGLDTTMALVNDVFMVSRGQKATIYSRPIGEDGDS